MTDLDKLRALAEAATPGPWEADHREVSQHWTHPKPWQTMIASRDVDCMAYCYGGTGRGIERPEDAEFIAAANPATVLDLLDRIKAVEALHASRDPGEEDAQCVGCLAVDPGAWAPWPCPTIKAVRGES